MRCIDHPLRCWMGKCGKYGIFSAVLPEVPAEKECRSHEKILRPFGQARGLGKAASRKVQLFARAIATGTILRPPSMWVVCSYSCALQTGRRRSLPRPKDLRAMQTFAARSLQLCAMAKRRLRCGRTRTMTFRRGADVEERRFHPQKRKPRKL